MGDRLTQHIDRLRKSPPRFYSTFPMINGIAELRYESMSITLKPEQAKFIQQQILTGRFKSESEVLEKVLQLLASQQQEYEVWAAEVCVKVDQAEAEIDRGEGVSLNVAMAQLQGRLRSRKLN